MRKPKQTHTKTNTKHNHRPAATRRTENLKSTFPPHSVLEVVEEAQLWFEQRRAVRGVAKCEGMPDHQNHHHVAADAKKVSRQAVVRRATAELPTDTMRYKAHSGQKCTYRWPNIPEGKQGPHAPHGGQPVGLTARTMQDQPRASHGGQPVEQPRATADTTCGFVVKPGQGWCQSEPSLTTYPSRNRGRGQQGFQQFQRRSLRKAAATDFRGERLPYSSQAHTSPTAEGQPARAPWFSQWGLDSKNSGCKTSPGHPKVANQWSNPEQQPT